MDIEIDRVEQIMRWVVNGYIVTCAGAVAFAISKIIRTIRDIRNDYTQEEQVDQDIDWMTQEYEI